jgi:hypothetical protein
MLCTLPGTYSHMCTPLILAIPAHPSDSEVLFSSLQKTLCDFLPIQCLPSPAYLYAGLWFLLSFSLISACMFMISFPQETD